MTITFINKIIKLFLSRKVRHLFLRAGEEFKSTFVRYKVEGYYNVSCNLSAINYLRECSKHGGILFVFHYKKGVVNLSARIRAVRERHFSETVTLRFISTHQTIALLPQLVFQWLSDHLPTEDKSSILFFYRRRSSGYWTHVEEYRNKHKWLSKCPNYEKLYQ